MSPDLADMAIVSRMAAALEGLPESHLDCWVTRFSVYPYEVVEDMPLGFAALDRAALHAGTTRRALRVGRGFSKQGVAA